jgi:parallel beta-helix repeat protein
MNLKKKQIFLVVLIIVSFSIPFFSVNYLKLTNTKKIQNTYNYDPRSSQWVLTSPITVNESDPTQNWANTAASEPWCSGSGIWSDPYVIDDVTIDLQNGDNSCISVFDSNVYFQIKDCTLLNAGWGTFNNAGIFLSNTNNGQLISNNCSSHEYVGIYLDQCDNNTISGNIASDNQNGIELDYSHYNTITGNAPYSNRANGIDVWRSDNNTIIGNVLSFNSYGITLGSTENCTVSGNTMSSCGISIYFNDYEFDEFLTNEIDISNTVNGKPVYYYTSRGNLGNPDFINSGQIILVNCTDSFLSNIDVTYTTLGIIVTFCKNITIFNSDFNNNVVAISTRYSSFINITNNIVSNNEAGISMYGCENSTISENDVNNNADLINMWGYGINVGDCENCNITSNTVNNNYESGLDVWHSEDLEINGNTLNYNRYGIQTNEISDCEIEDNIINGAVASLDNWDVGILLFPYWGGDSFNNTFKNNLMMNCGFILNDYENIEHMASIDIDTSNLVNGKPVYYYTNQDGLIPTNFTNAGQVFLINTNNSVIDNLLFSNTTVGIQTFYSHDNTISNCEFRYNKQNSFELWYSNDNEIVGSTFSNTNSYHLYLENSNGNHITDNSITDDPVMNPSPGIILSNCNNSFVLRNDISDCMVGIMANGEYNSFSGNNLSSNVDNGLYISYSGHNTVINNTINDNKWNGLVLESTYNSNIVNNTMNNNIGYGLRLEDSHSIIVSDNIFRCNTMDCWIDEGGTGNTFIDNVCDDCDGNGNGNGDGTGFVPGYNLLFIIGVLSVITIILLRKRRKH